ncbi:FecR family protein [Pedobacter frigoris]|uniref:DUF4974 domain-containing protein n=1 Tax=Pedobacter frigoris TaxID=2571272 RepID=A0A4U1CLB4_9SPHI|nr:FecR domain-containing protein [Pedobacter frigoris]TKC08581.1 DUF4974 domain-containing protein [Pedobacter frigoris]
MKSENIKTVLNKISSGKFNSQEEKIAKYWIQQLNQKKESGYSDEGLERVSQEMWSVIEKEKQNQTGRILRLRLRIAVAAAVAAIIFGAGMFYFSHDAKKNNVKDSYVNDINPGRIGATLTLADGKKIILSDATNGELAKEAGVSITKTADGQIVYSITNSEGVESGKTNSLSTAAGETYILTLPDKTKVWLNAASSIKYPANFAALKERRIQLTGEAYFEVAKLLSSPEKTGSKKIPFIVETIGQKVEVLGTHFNISSYSDEETKTTLLEGSVRVLASGADAKDLNDVVLKPKQQAILTGKALQIKAVEPNDVIAWKNGKFVFEREPIAKVMQTISRWYNVKIVYPGEIPDMTFTGSISRNDDISSILNKIEFTEAIHFKIEERRIIVMQ